MPRVLGPPYKPTRHSGALPGDWAWLRSRCVLALPFWSRGDTRLINLARRDPVAIPITFGSGGEWRDMRYGPGLHLNDTGYVDTLQTRIGGVGLFADTNEAWTAVVRFRSSDQATDGALLARRSVTAANATFSIILDRIGAAARTPRIVVRGTATDTSWNLDDGEWHTIWVTWDTVTCFAYREAAQARVTLGVGAAVEETTQRILIGARTHTAPGAMLTGDLDFCAILDVALSPAQITAWHEDLYAPWRPVRRRIGYQPVPPIIPPAPMPQVFARRPLAVGRVELWSDVEVNGGVRLAPVAHYISLTESRGVSGEHTVELTVQLHHPVVRLLGTPADDRNLRVNQVLRLVKTDGTSSEHRIGRPRRQNRGGTRTRTVVAHSIFQDLGFRGLVTKTEADGSSTTTFEALSLPMRDHLKFFILPAAREAGESFWEVGDMAHERLVDMSYNGDSPLSAIRQLQVKGGDLEAEGVRSETGYRINIVERIGADLEPLVVRSRKNLLDLSLDESSEDQATRVYTFGLETDGMRPSVGKGRWVQQSVVPVTGGMWDVVLADPAGGEGPIRFDDQFVPADILVDDPGTETVETVPSFQLKYLSGADFMAPIVTTIAATQTIRIRSDTAPPLAAGHSVRIVADSTGRENLFVDHPAMVARYGVRASRYYRDDIPATDNWIPNPFARTWEAGAPLPEGWQWDGLNSEVSRETNPRLWAHGGQAIRIKWYTALGTSPLVAPPALSLLNASGYASWMVRVITLFGRVRVQCFFERPLTAPAFPDLTWRYVVPDSTGSFGVGDIVLPDIENVQLNTAEDLGVAAAWDFTKYPLYGGPVTIQVLPARGAPDNTECIVQAVQVTNTPTQMPWLEGNGGVRLHQVANQRVGLHSTPAKTISVGLLDLAMLGGGPIPVDELREGRSLRIEDPASDVEALSVRVTNWTRDWENRTRPTVELSNQRRDIVSLLARSPVAPRHPSVAVPPGTRGLTYHP